MTTFEYVAVLVSIIVGLSITHLLDGGGRLIDAQHRAGVYWVHLLWCAYTFVYLISFWWWEFQLTAVDLWTVQLYLFLVLYATLLYLICVVLYPKEFPSDFREYFLGRRKWFFGTWLVVTFVDVADTALKGGDHLAGLGLDYWIASVSFALLCLVAMTSRNERFHAAFAVAMFAYSLYEFTWTPVLFGRGTG